MDMMSVRRRLLATQKTSQNINIWDEQWELGMIDTRYGGEYNSPNQIRNKNYISVKPNTKYYFYSGKSSQWALFYDADKNIISASDYPIPEPMTQSINAYAIRNKEFTTPSICYYMRFYCTVGYGNEYLHDISINYPSTDHDYHQHI